MKHIVIVDGARTPIGSFLGSLSSLSATKLGSCVIKAAIEKSHIDIGSVDEVIMGQVLQGGCGQAPARQASLGAGLGSYVPCTTVNKVCGSGLKAVMMAADSIALGRANVVVAGGMESMSNAPYILPGARQGFRMGEKAAVDLMIHDGLWDPYGHSHMGCFGDKCASEHGFTRESQDNYARDSYQKALRAVESGYFKDEIIPVSINHKKEVKVVEQDEEPYRYMPEKLAKLKAAFSQCGTVTAANASKINDGAAAIVTMSLEEAQKNNIPFRARIIAYETFAHDPQWFTTAPAGAIRKVLKSSSLSIDDIDLFEINEAFAVVALVAIKELSLPPEKINIFGGAVALGHPIGCSGARILITLVNALEKTQKRFGLAAICLGGGEAVAMIVERA